MRSLEREIRPSPDSALEVVHIRPFWLAPSVTTPAGHHTGQPRTDSPCVTSANWRSHKRGLRAVTSPVWLLQRPTRGARPVGHPQSRPQTSIASPARPSLVESSRACAAPSRFRRRLIARVAAARAVRRHHPFRAWSWGRAEPHRSRINLRGQANGGRTAPANAKSATTRPDRHSPAQRTAVRGPAAEHHRCQAASRTHSVG